MKSSFVVMKKTHKTMKQPIARRFGFVCVRNGGMIIRDNPALMI